MIKKETKPVVKTQTTQTQKTSSLSSSKPAIKTNTNISSVTKQQVSGPTKIVTANKINQQSQQPKNEENNQSLIKTLYINISIQKYSEQEQKLKDLNNILKTKAERIDLTLNTKFSSDNELLNFSTSIIKIAQQVNYLKWIVSGAFTDDGQAKCIGDTIAKFSKAYRIELELLGTYFADRGAKSLALAIKKLTNVHIFNLKIVENHNRIAKNLTYEGLQQIGQAISCMPKLEILETNLSSTCSDYQQKKYANFIYDLIFEYVNGIQTDGDNSEIWDEAYDSFVQNIESQKCRLTQVKLKRYRQDGVFISKEQFCTLNDDEQDQEMREKKYTFFLKQVIYLFDLPYLTQFEHSFEVASNTNPNSKYCKKIDNANLILQNLARNRFSTITQILAYKVNIQQYLNINPIMVLTDLFIQ